MFYIFQTGLYTYITVNPKTLKIGITSNLKKAAYWTSKKSAKSWENLIKKKFENAELKEAELKIVNK